MTGSDGQPRASPSSPPSPRSIILGREIVGLLKLGHLARIRRDVAVSLRTKDQTLERKTVQRFAHRAAAPARPCLGSARVPRSRAGRARSRRAPEACRSRTAWRRSTRKHAGAIIKSSKRVSVVTAMSPMVWVAMLYVVVENLRMLRTLSTLYGARPGGLGALRLARMVVTHIVATGGLAMTDDLLGQFLGQDLLRRLSRRLGEGAFNGALHGPHRHRRHRCRAASAIHRHAARSGARSVAGSVPALRASMHRTRKPEFRQP